MDAIPKPENHFFLDLAGQRAFCRLCRKPCRSLVLPSFTLFWCHTHSCENAAEVRLYANGRWTVCTMVEIWEEAPSSMESLSEINLQEILSIAPEGQVPDPRA